jgi:hypothetical protein
MYRALAMCEATNAGERRTGVIQTHRSDGAAHTGPLVGEVQRYVSTVRTAVALRMAS